MSIRAKQRGHRRERRKAKASGWARQPRRKFGVHVHGETGDVVAYLPGRLRLTFLRRDSYRNRRQRRPVPLSKHRTPVLSESLGDFW